MFALTAASAVAGCSASPKSGPSTVPSTPGAGPDLACDAHGQWELEIEGTGCPLPSHVVIIDAVGLSTSAGRTPAMNWTLSLATSSSGSCDVQLRGQAGRLFRVEADGVCTNSELTAHGKSIAGITAYGCGGDVAVTGKRRP